MMPITIAAIRLPIILLPPWLGRCTGTQPARVRNRQRSQSRRMRAIVITRHGGPDVLELRDEPAPEPGPGLLVVQVEAAGVSGRDVYEREGGSAHAAPTPAICGVEGAGTVVGSGERVAWVEARGSYAERVVVDAA